MDVTEGLLSLPLSVLEIVLSYAQNPSAVFGTCRALRDVTLTTCNRLGYTIDTCNGSFNATLLSRAARRKVNLELLLSCRWAAHSDGAFGLALASSSLVKWTAVTRLSICGQHARIVHLGAASAHLVGPACPNLRSLELAYVCVQGPGLFHGLMGCRQLSSLHMYKVDMDSKARSALRLLSSLPQLSTLSLAAEGDATTEALACLAPRLHSLTLYKSRVWELQPFPDFLPDPSTSSGSGSASSSDMSPASSSQDLSAAASPAVAASGQSNAAASQSMEVDSPLDAAGMQGAGPSGVLGYDSAGNEPDAAGNEADEMQDAADMELSSSGSLDSSESAAIVVPAAPASGIVQSGSVHLGLKHLDIRLRMHAIAPQLRNLAIRCPHITLLSLPEVCLDQASLDTLLGIGNSPGLRNLQDLSVANFSRLATSRSQHPCPWRRLAIRDSSLSASTLAALPLHSLTSRFEVESVLMDDEHFTPEGAVAVLREAAHNLVACPGLHLAGGCLGLVVFDAAPASLAPASALLEALAPLRHRVSELQVNGVVLGAGEVAALGRALGPGLARLHLADCVLQGSFWTALWSSLPALCGLKLWYRCEGALGVAHLAAFAAQPARRPFTLSVDKELVGEAVVAEVREAASHYGAPVVSVELE